jgi:hypothetical protein
MIYLIKKMNVKKKYLIQSRGENMKFFKKKEKKKIHKETGEEYLNCPRCKKHMKKIVKKEVVLDICKKCGGMWVDAGEIEKLAEEAQK